MWEVAYKSYMDGNKNEAINGFRRCLKIKPSDGPSKTLLEYSLENDFKDWRGFRELTDK